MVEIARMCEAVSTTRMQSGVRRENNLIFLVIPNDAVRLATSDSVTAVRKS
jgi:hypothetical protein